jgi:hypothetical protein
MICLRYERCVQGDDAPVYPVWSRMVTTAHDYTNAMPWVQVKTMEQATGSKAAGAAPQEKAGCLDGSAEVCNLHTCEEVGCDD